ncbi:MAG: S8 family serine peptidase [Bacteroidales bacterium]|nr:S8 family serine peptidase [Bacteroidales bacterium]
MKRKLSLIFLLPVLLPGSIGMPEGGDVEKNAIPGTLIVQFIDNDQDHDVYLLEARFSTERIQREKCLSADLGIWLFSYQTGKTPDRILLNRIKQERTIANVQFDHRLSLREVIPDDPEFENQWALKNTGQFDGLPDADIDASDAWEMAVNTGVNAFGDTIVMAIVDDGFSLSHEDMNYWKNRNEIPDNGVDDDNNGYIDDFDGWNAYYSNGYIQPKDHGQHVAGIAGAIGNNGIGVCGINWNGRVMTVAGSSTLESTVVEAYGYVYKMRSLYDETNGAQGAYVVVTNASFGVDFGDPDNYPVWGAMYDSLGSLGILNVGATINGPWDVDEVGDIPTTFPTDYIIGVTNTTYDDEKNLGAGWGKISIDLGAPGKSIMSTRIPNTYGYKTGTSMAAPQVTGSIALMYAAADEAFMQRYADEPETIALFVKNLLLDAVDTLTGFDTLCVSGGRLNVNNALQKLINPRIVFSRDTLQLSLAPDSTACDTVYINNLLGFGLAYETAIPMMSEWISYTEPSGMLAAHGSDTIIFTFDATGLDEETFISALVITDIAGMSSVLPLIMKVVSPDGISEPWHNAISGIEVWPNPFRNDLTVSVETPDQIDLLIRIFSAGGDLAGSWEFQSSPTDNTIFKWDGRNAGGRPLPSGIYFIELSGGGMKVSKRVLKITG